MKLQIYLELKKKRTLRSTNAESEDIFNTNAQVKATGETFGEAQEEDWQRQDRSESKGFTANVSEENSVQVNNCKNKLELVLDSGCFDHIVNDAEYFIKF